MKLLVFSLTLVSVAQDPSSLFPVEKGNKWVYTDGTNDYTADINSVTRQKDSVKASMRILGKEFKEELGLQITENGVLVTSRMITVGSVIHKTSYAEGVLIVPFPPTKDREVVARMTVGKKEATRKLAVKGEEEIKVPAGEFKASRILITLATDSGTIEEEELWVAEDAGIVKRRVKGGDWGNKEMTFELKEKKLKKSAAQKQFDPVDSAITALLDAAESESKDGNTYVAHAISALFRNFSDDERLTNVFDETAAAIREKPDSAIRKPVHLKKVVEMRLDTSDPKTELIQMMAKTVYEVADGLSAFNLFRKAVGLRGVTLDSGTSRGCYMHSRYLAKNGYLNPIFKSFRDYHTEDSANQFFTEEGKSAAAHSVVAGTKPTTAITEWMDTFYHRVPLLNPGLTAVGIGTWLSSVDTSTPSCMDIVSFFKPAAGGSPTIYPCPGQKNVKRNFNETGEMPAPVKEVDPAKLGTVVTLCWFGMEKIELLESSMQCERKEIEHYASSPGKPSNPEGGTWSNCSIALIPKKPLPVSATIKIKVKCKIDSMEQSYEFEFQTGE